MANPRYLRNTKNGRIVSYNPTLAQRSDMMACDVKGNFVGEGVQGEGGPVVPEGLTAPKTSPVQDAPAPNINPVAAALEAEEAATTEQTVEAVAVEPSFEVTENPVAAALEIEEQVEAVESQADTNVNPVAEALEAEAAKEAEEAARREYCMNKGLSSLNRPELVDIATFFNHVVTDDDTMDDLKEVIKKARAKAE